MTACKFTIWKCARWSVLDTGEKLQNNYYFLCHTPHCHLGLVNCEWPAFGVRYPMAYICMRSSVSDTEKVLRFPVDKVVRDDNVKCDTQRKFQAR